MSIAFHNGPNRAPMAHNQSLVTPPFIYRAFMDAGFWDPCPLVPQVDGLVCDWEPLCYVNPPYNNILAWLIKAEHEIAAGHTSRAIFLLPARLSASWWGWLLAKRGEVVITALRERLRFGDYQNKSYEASIFVELSRELSEHGGSYEHACQSQVATANDYLRSLNLVIDRVPMTP